MKSLWNYNPDCTLCPLHEGATTVCVAASGIPKYPGLIVGEAPGRSEDLAGRPFVGQAGRVLDWVLKDLGVTRDEIVVTNAVKCRPPSNRKPTRRELDACVEKYLVAEIKRVDPTHILGMGNTALQALHEVYTGGITQYRGVWIPGIPGRNHVQVLYTFHPAYVNYQGWDSVVGEQFRDDLQMFVQAIRKREV